MAGSCRPQAKPPAPKENDAVWQRVGTWSGRGNAQLDTFPVGGWTWRAHWETRNETGPGTGTFHATVHSGDSGRQIAEIADARGVDHDTTYVTELPHRYYFVVTSSNLDWTITVEEAVIK
jgi:hypothetical protein